MIGQDNLNKNTGDLTERIVKRGQAMTNHTVQYPERYRHNMYVAKMTKLILVSNNDYKFNHRDRITVGKKN